MAQALNTQQLLQLRKLTRTLSDQLKGQLREYLATLSPLLRPRMVLGDYVQSSVKETVRGADKVFKDLQAFYESVAGASPFHLAKELKPPIELMSSTLEMIAFEYSYSAKGLHQEKNVAITSPLKWVLVYSGYPLSRLRQILLDRNRSESELRESVLHHLVLNVVLTKQSGLTRILEALNFPVLTETLPGLGQLPITVISSTLSTLRPSDEVIIENTEISGTDAFEELINTEDIRRLANPFKESLAPILKSHGFEADT